jgi:hypothetical protein
MWELPCGPVLSPSIPYIEWIVVRNRDEWKDIMVDDMEERIFADD